MKNSNKRLPASAAKSMLCAVALPALALAFGILVSALPSRAQGGGFVYCVADNLGGSVLGFSVDAATGALSPLPGSPFQAGDHPSSVTVDPTGRFVFATVVHQRRNTPREKGVS